MKPSTFLTAGEASRATGKSIPTITRAVKNGRIANSRKGDDGYEIDPVALSNVYPFIDTALGGKSNETPNMLGDATPQIDSALQQTIDTLNRLITEKDKAVEKADENAEHWRTEYQRTQNQLTDQRTEVEKANAKLVAVEAMPKPVIKRRKLSLKERIFGGEVTEVEEVA